MKNAQLAKRINDLAEKLKPVPSEGIRIDFDSFTDPEKYVLLKNIELEEKYDHKLPVEVFMENMELCLKANHILIDRVTELFQFIFPRALMMNEVEQYMFKINFVLFLMNLKESLAIVKKWSQHEKDEFLSEINEKPADDNDLRKEEVVDGEENHY